MMRIAEFYPWWEIGDREAWNVYSDDPFTYIFHDDDGMQCVVQRDSTPSGLPAHGTPHDCEKHTVWVTLPRDLRGMGKR